MNRKINKIAVVGSGVMGSGIACHFANIGIEVLLLDIAPNKLNDSENKIDSTKTKIETNSFHDLPIDLKTSYSSEMSKFKQILEQDYDIWKNANRDLESFKDEHGINREVIIKTPTQIIISLFIIAVLISPCKILLGIVIKLDKFVTAFLVPF